MGQFFDKDLLFAREPQEDNDNLYKPGATHYDQIEGKLRETFKRQEHEEYVQLRTKAAENYIKTLGAGGSPLAASVAQVYGFEEFQRMRDESPRFYAAYKDQESFRASMESDEEVEQVRMFERFMDWSGDLKLATQEGFGALGDSGTGNSILDLGKYHGEGSFLDEGTYSVWRDARLEEMESRAKDFELTASGQERVSNPFKNPLGFFGNWMIEAAQQSGNIGSMLFANFAVGAVGGAVGAGAGTAATPGIGTAAGGFAGWLTARSATVVATTTAIERGHIALELIDERIAAGEPVYLGRDGSIYIGSTVGGLINGVFEALGGKAIKHTIGKPLQDSMDKADIKRAVMSVLKNEQISEPLFNAFRDYGLAMAGEAGTEATQEFVSAVVGAFDKAGYDDTANVFREVLSSDTLTRMLHGAAAGAQVAGVFGAPGTVQRGYRAARGEPGTSREQVMLDQIENDERNIAGSNAGFAIMGQMKQALEHVRPWAAKSPEEAHAYLEEALQGRDGEVVILNAQDALNFAEQSPPEDMIEEGIQNLYKLQAAVRDLITKDNTYEEVQEIAKEGGAIEVQGADFLMTELSAPGSFESLQNSIKLRHNHYTVEEALIAQEDLNYMKDFMAENEANIDQILEDEDEVFDADWREQITQVFEQTGAEVDINTNLDFMKRYISAYALRNNITVQEASDRLQTRIKFRAAEGTLDERGQPQVMPQQQEPVEFQTSQTYEKTIPIDQARQEFESDPAKFTDQYLAGVQRGVPERAMTELQTATGGSVLNGAAEHIGDITHRMTHSTSPGYDVVGKIEKTLGWLENGYGFERELTEQLDSNAKLKSGEEGFSEEEWRNNISSKMEAYADAHRKLPVFNIYQKLARDAAVALGEGRFDDSASLLRKLKAEIEAYQEANPELNEQQQFRKMMEEDSSFDFYLDDRSGGVGPQFQVDIDDTTNPNGNELSQKRSVLSDINPFQTRISVYEVGKHLAKQNGEKFGVVADDDYSDAAVERFGNAMAAEVMLSRKVVPENTGKGWYSKSYNDMIDTMGLVFPELVTDKDARQVFTVIMAITSNGELVENNFKLAFKVYKKYRRSKSSSKSGIGRIDSSLVKSKRSDNMAKAINAINDKMQDSGSIEETLSWLMDMGTVREFNKEHKAKGLPELSGWPADMIVPRSLFMGPKIGIFFANLMGREDFLTIDLWMMRSIGRYRGSLTKNATGRESVDADGNRTPAELSSTGKKQGIAAWKDEWLEEKVRNSEMIEPDEQFDPDAFSDEVAMKFIAEDWASYKAKDYANGVKGETSANTIYKATFLELQESPRNNEERVLILKSVKFAQEKLMREEGVELEVADIQAILWYYEKRLYADLSSAKAKDVSYSDAAYKFVSENYPKLRAKVEKRQIEQSNVLDNLPSPSGALLPVVQSITIGLSSYTSSIEGIKKVGEAAQTGDAHAIRVLQDMARVALTTLMSNIPSAQVNAGNATGLYGGELEPSLNVTLSFDKKDRRSVLAQLAKFADNFNQEQVHARESAEDSERMGKLYNDGSFITPVYTYILPGVNHLTQVQIQDMIDKSGVPGLTVTYTVDGAQLETYYATQERKTSEELNDFLAATRRLNQDVRGRGGSVRRTYARIWQYGHGGEAISYEDIAKPSTGKLRASEDAATAQNGVAQQLAAYTSGRDVAAGKVPRKLTKKQEALQRKITKAYIAMSDNALDERPLVREAYAELAAEVERQYSYLPVSIELWTDENTQPYANSKAMQRDVMENNHLYVYQTQPGGFGPKGVVYNNHPLLDSTSTTDINGLPMLVNDKLRAVHDYYAHTMSAAQFGVLGEEVAWRNHMNMTVGAKARWALTSETRGQNSWFHFGPEEQNNRFAKRNKNWEPRFAPQKVDLLPVEYAMTGDHVLDAELLAAHDAETAQDINMFQADDALPAPPRATLSSGLQDAINNAQVGKKGWSAERWLSVLKKTTKASEIEWTGLTEFLELKKGQSLSKEDMQNFFNENRVVIVPEVRGLRSQFDADKVAEDFNSALKPVSIEEFDADENQAGVTTKDTVQFLEYYFGDIRANQVLTGIIQTFDNDVKLAQYDTEIEELGGITTMDYQVWRGEKIAEFTKSALDVQIYSTEETFDQRDHGNIKIIIVREPFTNFPNIETMVAITYSDRGDTQDWSVPIPFDTRGKSKEEIAKSLFDEAFDNQENALDSQNIIIRKMGLELAGEEASPVAGGRASLMPTKYEKYTIPGGKNYSEVLYKWESAPQDFTFDPDGHFDEALGTIVHARLKDREIDGYGDTHVVEEAQSDKRTDIYERFDIAKENQAKVREHWNWTLQPEPKAPRDKKDAWNSVARLFAGADAFLPIMSITRTRYGLSSLKHALVYGNYGKDTILGRTWFITQKLRDESLRDPDTDLHKELNVAERMVENILDGYAEEYLKEYNKSLDESTFPDFTIDRLKGEAWAEFHGRNRTMLIEAYAIGLRGGGEHTKGYELSEGGKLEEAALRQMELVVEDVHAAVNAWRAAKEPAVRKYLDNLSPDIDAPFVENYGELVIKYAIIDAINNDQDAIAWTHSSVQINRWESEQRESISKIDWTKTSDGSYVLDVHPIDTDAQVLTRTAENENELKTLVGSANFNTMMDNATTYPGGILGGTLEGGDLKIAKQGMIDVYDKKMVGAAKKLGKQFGVAPVLSSVDQEIESIEASSGTRGTTTRRHPIWIMRITQEMKEEIRERGISMFQPEDSGQQTPEPVKEPYGINGYFNNSTGILGLTPTAREGTLPHELAHQFFWETIGLAKAGNEDAMRELNTMLEYIRQDGEPELSLQDVMFDGTESEELHKIKRERHERFARGFELYLAEGQAPSPALAELFAKFRDWLVEYVEVYIKSGKVAELTDDIREIYRKMIDVDAELLTARDVISAHPISNEYLKMSPEEREQYEADIEGAIQSGKRELDKKLVQSANRKLSAPYRALKTKFTKEEEEKIKDEPVYMFRSVFMRPGAKRKLSLNSVESALSRTSGKAEHIRGLSRVWGDNDLLEDAEVVAEEFGFGSAKKMLVQVSNSQAKKKEIEERVQARLDAAQEADDSLVAPLDPTSDAVAALHNKSWENAIVSELSALERLTGKQRRVPAEVLKANAQRKIDSQRLKQIKPQTYIQQERIAAGRALKAMKSGNVDEAIRQKNVQLMNQYLYRAADKRLKSANKRVKQMQRLLTKAGSAGIDESFRPHIMSILDRVDLRVSAPTDELVPVAERETVTPAMTKSLIEELSAIMPIRVPDDSIIFAENKVPWHQLTSEQFDDLFDAVWNLRTLGKNFDSVKLSPDATAPRQQAAPIREAIAQSVRAHILRKKPTLGKKARDKNKEKSKHSLQNYMAQTRKRANAASEIDGFNDLGPAFENLIAPARDAVDAKEVRLAAEFEKLTGLFKRFGITGRHLKTKSTVVVRGEEISFTKEELLSMALNHGNAENRQRLYESVASNAAPAGQTRGEAGGQEITLEAFKYISDQDWDFVQAVWDYLDSFWPDIQALEERTTGVIPKRVEPVPFQTPSGKEMSGGYYPISYDLTKKKGQEDSVNDFAKEARQGIAASAMTAHNHTKKRVGSGGRILTRDIMPMFIHVDEVVHDITHREVLNSVWQILNTKMESGETVNDVIEDHMGQPEANQWNEWLNRMAVGDRRTHIEGMKALGRIRARVSVMAMGLNFSTALLQFMGVTQTIAHNKTAFAIGLKEYTANRINPIEWRRRINEQSVLMRNRSTTFQRDMREIQTRLNKSRPMQLWDRAMFAPIMIAQGVVDGITWSGFYNLALQNGETEKMAVKLADDAVVKTQGSGRIMDISAVEGGEAWQKLFTTFYSYLNTLLNLAWDKQAMVRRSDANAVEKFVKMGGYLFVMYILPTTLQAMIQDWLIAGDEPEEGILSKEAGMHLLSENASFMVAQFPYIREFYPDGYRYTGPAGMRGFSVGRALIESLGDLAPGGDEFADGVNPIEDPWEFLQEPDVLNMVDGLALVGNVPTTSIKRMIRGGAAIAEGETEGVIDPVTGLLFYKKRD